MKKIDLKLLSPLYAAIGIVFLFGCDSIVDRQQKKNLLHLLVTNNTELSRNDVLVSVDINGISNHPIDTAVQDLAVYSGATELASQYCKTSFRFIVDNLKPWETRKFTIKPRSPHDPKPYFPKRTQSELSVKKGGYFENRKYIGGKFEDVTFLRLPKEHTDHSYFIKYEGPGWESDKVAYRFYQDWRRATDVFGKKTNLMVLQKVGLDDFDSYHKMQSWGMDILKVGKSLGVGTLASFYQDKTIHIDNADSVTCEVGEDGIIFSSIKSNYYGWKIAGNSIDIESTISIHAGTRLSHHKVKYAGQIDNLCTGIGKDPQANLFTSQGGGAAWGYIATYGVQSINNDRLGLAVFFKNEHYRGFTEDEHNHIVKFRTDTGILEYYFLAAWEGEFQGIKNEDEFILYVNKTSIELANPVELSLE